MRIALIVRDRYGAAIVDAFPAEFATLVGLICLAPLPAIVAGAAKSRGVMVHSVASLSAPEAMAALRVMNADIAVMGFADETVPRALLDLPPKGTIQVHLGLLPRYRGPSPVEWPIARGEIGTGVSVIRPSDVPYEGAVILQRTCTIGPDDTAGELTERVLMPLAAEALAEAARLVVRGEHIEIEQDEDAATYEGAFGEAEAEIHWATHAATIYNLIRAANPSPGAWTHVDGRKLRILDACFHPVHRHAEVRGLPGEVGAVDEDAFSVCAQGGEIEVRRVVLEGEAPTKAAEFAKQAGFVPGRRLGA